MAKKLVAVTNIEHDGEFIPAGETLDASKFDRKQLEALYDNGAVRVEGEDERTSDSSTAETERSPKEQQLHEENQRVSADESAAASSPVGEPKSPAAKSTTAAQPKESTNAKSNTK